MCGKPQNQECLKDRKDENISKLQPQNGCWDFQNHQKEKSPQTQYLEVQVLKKYELCPNISFFTLSQQGV